MDISEKARVPIYGLIKEGKSEGVRSSSGELWLLSTIPEDLTQKIGIGHEKHERVVKELSVRSHSLDDPNSVADARQFITEDWDDINEAIVEGSGQQGRSQKNQEKVRYKLFHNVYLGDPGYIDVVGVGSDGNIVLINFVSSEKHQDFSDQIKDFINILRIPSMNNIRVYTVNIFLKDPKQIAFAPFIPKKSS